MWPMQLWILFPHFSAVRFQTKVLPSRYFKSITFKSEFLYIFWVCMCGFCEVLLSQKIKKKKKIVRRYLLLFAELCVAWLLLVKMIKNVVFLVVLESLGNCYFQLFKWVVVSFVLCLMICTSLTCYGCRNICMKPVFFGGTPHWTNILLPLFLPM